MWARGSTGIINDPLGDSPFESLAAELEKWPYAEADNRRWWERPSYSFVCPVVGRGDETQEGPKDERSHGALAGPGGEHLW